MSATVSTNTSSTNTSGTPASAASAPGAGQPSAQRSTRPTSHGKAAAQGQTRPAARPATAASTRRVTLAPADVLSSPTTVVARTLWRGRDKTTAALSIISQGAATYFLLTVSGGLHAFAKRYELSQSWSKLHPNQAPTLETMYYSYASTYLILAVIATVMMVIPLLSLAGAAARLGLSRRERDLARLRLLGATGGQVRGGTLLVQCAYAMLGALIGAVGYVATLPAWGSLRFTGHSLGVGNMWLGLPLLLLALAMVVTLAGVSAATALQRVAVTPLGVSRQALPAKVHWIRAVALVAVLVVWMSLGSSLMGGGTAVALTITLIFFAIGGFMINLVGPLLMWVLGAIMHKFARRPAMLLASRRIMNDPKSLWRCLGGVALVSFVVAVLQLGASASAGSDDAMARVFAHDMLQGLFITLGIVYALAAVSTAIGQGVRVLDQAGELRSLMRAGAPLQLLTTARRLETIIPAVFAASGAAVVGLAFTAPVLGGGMFQSQGALLMLGSLVGGTLLVILASEACGPITKQVLREQTRQE